MRPIIFLVVAVSVVLPTMLLSQWEPTNGPFGGPVNTMTMSGTALFAGTNLGVYRSTDNGGRWVNPGLTTLAINAFGLNGTTVFAGTEHGAYRSTDNGLSWELMTGMTTSNVNAFVTVGSTIYVGTDSGLFRSTNNGTQWSAVGYFTKPIKRVTHLATTKSTAGSVNIFAGCFPNGLYQSKDNGATWTQPSPGGGSPSLPKVFSGEVYIAVNRIFATAFGDITSGQIDVLYSTDYLGGTMDWKADPFSQTNERIVLSGLSNPAHIFKAQIFKAMDFKEEWALLRQNDTTTNWSSIHWDLLDYVGNLAQCVLINGAVLFIGSDRGIMKSTDDGLTWKQANTGMKNSKVVNVAMVPVGPGVNKLFAVTPLGIYWSTNGGNTWEQSRLPLRAEVQDGLLRKVQTIVSIRNYLGQYSILAAGDGFLRSTDAGLTWEMPIGQQGGNGPIRGMAVVGSDVLTVYGETAGIIRRSYDSGLSWHEVAQIPTGYTSRDRTSIAGPITLVGSSLLVNTHRGLMRSLDYGINWHEFDRLETNIVLDFALAEKALFASTGHGVFCSLDEGNSWIEANRGLPSDAIDLQSCGSRVFAATPDSGVYITGNFGFNWKQVNSQLTNKVISSLASDGTDVYVGTEAGVFHYTGALPAATSLTPSVTGGIVAGKPFWVEVKIGDPIPVQNLQAVGFVLASSSPYCELVVDSVVRGPFLATTLNKFTVLDGQTVRIALEQQPKPGKSGSGIVARAQFTTEPNLPGSSDVSFSLRDVWAVDSAGNRMDLNPGSASYRIVSGGANVWPGDCNSNAAVDAADILPIGVNYGQSLGTENVPGVLWQAYNRELWQDDSPKKKIYADANGDGVINSADLLPIGLNYSKRHAVAVKVGLTQGSSDGAIEFGQAVKKGPGQSFIQVPLRLKALKPVYGIAFSVKYGVESASSPGALKLTLIDTMGSVLGGELMMTHIFEDQMVADVGLTKTRGFGFVGEGQLAILTMDVPDGSPYWVDITNVVGNDEKGNPVYIAGSTYHSGTATAIEEAIVPLENALLQNYPNPFNPQTTIRFQLSEAGSVTLKVFDVLGREVVTLLNERRAAGSFSAIWDAGKVPSGIYYCRMTAQNESGHIFTQTQRMLLVK